MVKLGKEWRGFQDLVTAQWTTSLSLPHRPATVQHATMQARKEDKTMENELEMSLRAQMLDALELFYYAGKYNNRLLVLSFARNVQFADVIADLKILETSNINVVLIIEDSESVRSRIKQLNYSGSVYEIFSLSSRDNLSVSYGSRIKESINAKRIPAILVGDMIEKSYHNQNMDEISIQIATQLRAEKLLFLSEESGLQVNNIFYPHPSAEDIEKFLNSPGVNIDPRRLQLICDEHAANQLDIVLLKCENGCIFNEIFTHNGSGTLFTDHAQYAIRRAVPTDTNDITFLIKAGVSDGGVLPISDDEVFKNINNFFVYTSNSAIVAAVMLKDYGSWAEIGKLTALPRYQRKGRASELVLHVIDEARKQGKEYVFALSILPSVWTFFKNLGMSEISRSQLPETWKEGYDFARQSKAFVRRL